MTSANAVSIESETRLTTGNGCTPIYLMRSEWAKLIIVSTVHLAIFLGSMWKMSIAIEHRFTAIEERQQAANSAASRDREVQGEMLRQIREDMRELRSRNVKP